MGSPLRQILRQALSPITLKPLKSPVFLNTTSCLIQSDITRSKFLTKCPQFTTSKNGKHVLETTKFQPEKSVFEKNRSNIKITVSEPNESDGNEIISLPFVNTPDRESILKTGTVPKDKLKILGKGTYGTVVKAIYKDKQIAVKVVANKLANSSLQREINALNLNHSNIVKTMKVVCEANKKYGVVIMEDCSDSINMQTILDKSEFIVKLPDIVKWCLDICSGIQYCHENNILHLDIKPKNILVQGNKCKICDFGNSVNMKCIAQIRYTNQGTVGYTAPELFQNMIPDCSADIYSLGITMWQMESRQLPYTNLDSKDAIIYFVVKHNLRPIKAKHVKSEYSDIYQRCWVAEKTLRPSIKEVMNILKQF